MKVTDLLTDVNDLLQPLVGNRYSFGVGSQNKEPDFHSAVNNRLSEFLSRRGMEYNSWRITLSDPSDSILKWQPVFTLDIDFKNDKGYVTYRRGRLLAIEFKPVVEIKKDVHLVKYFACICLDISQKDMKELKEKQRQHNEALNNLLKEEIFLQQKINSLLNRTK